MGARTSAGRAWSIALLGVALGGCAHATDHDVPTRELHKLAGYPQSGPVALFDRRGSKFSFDSAWTLDIVEPGPEGPSHRPTRFASIDRADTSRLEGTVVSATTSGWVGGAEDAAPRSPERVSVDLTGVPSVRFFQASRPVASHRASEDTDHAPMIVAIVLGGAVVAGVTIGLVYWVGQQNKLVTVSVPPGGLVASDLGPRRR